MRGALRNHIPTQRLNSGTLDNNYSISGPSTLQAHITGSNHSCAVVRRNTGIEHGMAKRSYVGLVRRVG